MMRSRGIPIKKQILVVFAVLFTLLSITAVANASSNKGWYPWEKSGGWYDFKDQSSSGSSGIGSGQNGNASASQPGTTQSSGQGYGSTTGPGSITPPWQQQSSSTNNQQMVLPPTSNTGITNR